MPPAPTPLYHITHTANLAGIAANGLRSVRAIREFGAGYTNIAHQNIQDRRATTPVPCCVGGSLHDYVPFYFAPRSPMLYVISKGGVAGYAEGQAPIVHLVSSAQAIEEAGLPFAFTDGHGTMSLTEFFDDLEELDQIDWAIMKAKMWADTSADGDRCRRRQAEFLVHGTCPWTLIQAIGVLNAQIQRAVEGILAPLEHQPPVVVRSAWYY